MKRTGAVIRLVVWILTAMILSSLLFAALDWDGSFSFNFGGFSYNNADEYTEGAGEIDVPAGGINEIEINWVSGSITVEPSLTDKLTVSEKGAEDSDSTLRYLVKNGKLTVQFAKSRLFGFIRLPKKDLTVKIPKSIAELTMLDLNVVSSDTQLSDISAKEIKFDSVSGDLDVKNVTCQKLDAETVSGDVSFVHMGQNSTPHSFEMETVSGNMTVKTLNAPDSLNCDSVSGDVTIAFALCDGFTADYDKVSGKFSSDFPIKEISDEKIYGSGQARFSFDTVSGNVRIEKLEASNEPSDTDDGKTDTGDTADSGDTSDSQSKG